MSTLPTWTDICWRITWVALFISACIAAFFVLNHPWALGVELAQALMLYIFGVIVVAAPLSVIAVAPMKRLQRQLRDGVVTTDLVAADVIDALQLPRRVFVLLVGVLDSDHYPVLEELGFITIEPLDNGGPRIVDDLSGFEDVVRFGGIGNPLNLERAASIGEISGFNSVEVVDGSLEASAVLTGFQSLRVVEGTVDVANLPAQAGLERIGGDLDLNASYLAIDLPNLESIGGDLLVQRTRMTEIGFPALQRIGGGVTLYGNSRFAVWAGFGPDAVIGGDFEAVGNSPLRDEDFEAWVASGAATIDGTVRICANEAEGKNPCTE